MATQSLSLLTTDGNPPKNGILATQKNATYGSGRKKEIRTLKRPQECLAGDKKAMLLRQLERDPKTQYKCYFISPQGVHCPTPSRTCSSCNDSGDVFRVAESLHIALKPAQPEQHPEQMKIVNPTWSKCEKRTILTEEHKQKMKEGKARRRVQS